MTQFDHSIETPPRAPSPVHKFGTLAVHAGSPHDPVTGAVIEPVSQSEQSFGNEVYLMTMVDLIIHYLCTNSRWEASRGLRVRSKLKSEQVSMASNTECRQHLTAGAGIISKRLSPLSRMHDLH